jgi:hypothetical protein
MIIMMIFNNMSSTPNFHKKSFHYFEDYFNDETDLRVKVVNNVHSTHYRSKFSTLRKQRGVSNYGIAIYIKKVS